MRPLMFFRFRCRTVGVVKQTVFDCFKSEIPYFKITRLSFADFFQTLAIRTFNLGRIPRAGEKVKFGNVAFSILDADDRKINKLRVEVLGRERKES